MRRYLRVEEVQQALCAGRSVEQWLGATGTKPSRILRWVRLERGPDLRFDVTLFEMFDTGNADFLDVYAFPAVDADAPSGCTDTFATTSEAIEHACAKWGASPERFVNAGVIQDEYADSLKR